MIYIDENIWDFDLQEALAAVSPERREYALRYRQELDQRLCVAAYRLLQRALQQEYGITECPQLSYASNGKPSLIRHAPGTIHISLSHCDKAVACAVSASPVGIDVETFDHYSEDVARSVMSENELHEILASARPEVAFTRFWTMKESFYKLVGDEIDSHDIPHMLDKAETCRFTTIIHPEFAITCCSFNSTPKI